jgi:hypothetical protein
VWLVGRTQTLGICTIDAPITGEVHHGICSKQCARRNNRNQPALKRRLLNEGDEADRNASEINCQENGSTRVRVIAVMWGL